ncbi:MAG: hypothetical protein WA869_26520, partial [Alloacidobacterium sp.]
KPDTFAQTFFFVPLDFSLAFIRRTIHYHSSRFKRAANFRMADKPEVNDEMRVIHFRLSSATCKRLQMRVGCLPEPKHILVGGLRSLLVSSPYVRSAPSVILSGHARRSQLPPLDWLRSHDRDID